MTILLVGAGKMGSHFLDNWLAVDVAVIEPHPTPELLARSVRMNPQPEEMAAVVLAVMPQTAPEALPAVVPFIGPETVIVSVMAGCTLAYLESVLPGVALVRAMPSLAGISVAIANARVTEAQRSRAHTLLGAIGGVEWVADETLMDAVTALSGSGPAYVYLLVEAMTEAGAVAGLPPELAAKLARATVAGAGELLRQSPESPATLRQNLTSPGGTTAAALDVLQELRPLMRRAIVAATDRSRALTN
jgi:pyrroline-5-carboxylate reductase